MAVVTSTSRVLRGRERLGLVLLLVSLIWSLFVSLIAAPLVSASAGGAAAPSYVALGDSYASGLGTRSYLDDGTSCKRSVYAHPSLIATQRGYALNFRACSGATVPDVTNLQLSALSSTTSYVTVSVGGNDAGFADVLTECATPWWAGDCNGAIDDAQSYIKNVLPGALTTLYQRIGNRAPNATVVVSGYPRIFMGEVCNAGTWFSPAEMQRLNETANLLNNRTSSAVSAAGFSFANPTKRFVGHAVCDDVEWINGLSNPTDESYHPNRDGQAKGYQPVVGRLLTGTSTKVTASTLQSARASSDKLAAQQQRYAQRDRTIEPESFLAPDLTTPVARAAARRAGIDLERWLERHGSR